VGIVKSEHSLLNKETQQKHAFSCQIYLPKPLNTLHAQSGEETCSKSLIQYAEFEPRTVQPVASRYTDWAISVPQRYKLNEYQIRILKVNGNREDRKLTFMTNVVSKFTLVGHQKSK
jgi:hypothetical protein